MKKSVLFILILSFILLESFLVSAVCCEKVISGDWCQDAEESQCDLSNDLRMNFQSCDRTTYCALGTCVDVNAGTCSPNTERTVCEKEGGTWDSKKINEIEMCKNGCCVLGEDVAFVNAAECKRMGSKYAINSVFNADVKTELACFALAEPTEIGACVFSGEYDNSCKMIPRADCLAQDGKFNRGLLCTAPGLSNCAKTSKTMCKDEKVYFLDSCNNFANVYNSKMFTSDDSAWTPEMEGYWTKIQDPTCNVNKDGAASCGNCNYLEGSTCSAYKAGITKPDYGENVCKSLACTYNGKTYQHGESWCAEGTGLNPGITVDPNTGYIGEDERKILIDNYDTLNLPGTESMMLRCADGEVIKEACGPFRGKVCKQGMIGEFNNFSTARCLINNWRSCVYLKTKEDCVNPVVECKWITGERFDGAILTEDRRENEQGSCVPLIAPGFRFYDVTQNQSGSEICAMGVSTMGVVYETPILERRANFDKQDLDASDGNSVHQDCLENCYAIPKYGDALGISGMIKVWKGESVSNLQTTEVSLAKGQYCTRDTNANKTKLGKETGDNINCIVRGSVENEGFFENVAVRMLPLFYTNSQWVSFLTERTRSLGDCGYKLGASGDYSPTSSEVMLAKFQTVKQNGELKEDVTETCIISEATRTGLKLNEENYYRSGGSCSDVYTFSNGTNGSG